MLFNLQRRLVGMAQSSLTVTRAQEGGASCAAVLLLGLRRRCCRQYCELAVQDTSEGARNGHLASVKSHTSLKANSPDRLYTSCRWCRHPLDHCHCRHAKASHHRIMAEEEHQLGQSLRLSGLQVSHQRDKGGENGLDHEVVDADSPAEHHSPKYHSSCPCA